MGRVYLGRAEGGATVAVKVIQAEYAQLPEFRRRFAREVAAARKVGGNWTAPVRDADTDAPVPWVATGYVPGPDLHTVVETFGHLPERSVAALGHGLLHALRDVHAAGLVHRDLKPSNVLVTVDGPRVIDFGIARALETLAEGRLTHTGAVIGSPAFMSPEQARGKRLTYASDVFSFGSVLAFAATGRSPFGTADGGIHALLFRVAEESPDLSGLPAGLRPVVESCLAKDPESRPSVGELLARTKPPEGPWLPAEVLHHLGQESARLLNIDMPQRDPAHALEAIRPRSTSDGSSGTSAGHSATVREASKEDASTIDAPRHPSLPGRQPSKPDPAADSRRSLTFAKPRSRGLLFGALAIVLAVTAVTLVPALGRPDESDLPVVGTWELSQPALSGAYRRLTIDADSRPGGSPAQILFINRGGGVLCQGVAPVIERSGTRVLLGPEEIERTVPRSARKDQCDGKGRQAYTMRQQDKLRAEPASPNPDDSELIRVADPGKRIAPEFLGNWWGVTNEGYYSTYRRASLSVTQAAVGEMAVTFELSDGPDGARCNGEAPLLLARDDSIRLGPAEISPSSAVGCSPKALVSTAGDMTLLLDGQATIPLL
ncbi:serine/threonine-protein kinase [Streptomyces sp. enrichment culture]|uniref:serine/threonine-protein kinase n=1 Tax=Streptomyces sp. enrichment culture TaxID=1795815 RepID=UPI003F56C799